MSPFEEPWKFSITYLAISLYRIGNPFCSWIRSKMKTWILRSTHLRMPQVEIGHQVGICLDWSSFNYFKTSKLLWSWSDWMWSHDNMGFTLTVAQWLSVDLAAAALLEIRIISCRSIEIKVIGFIVRDLDDFWITICILNMSSLTVLLFCAFLLRRSQRPWSFHIIALWKCMMGLSFTQLNVY